MVRRINIVFTCLAVALVMAPAANLSAQEELGRFRVLVPNFEPREDANRKFGEKAAEELRDLINTLATHQPIAKKEIEQNLKRFKMKMEDLDCIRTRQLATQLNAKVALCASYVERGEKQYEVTAEFWDIAAGESYTVDPSMVGEKDQEAAAQQIFSAFDGYVQQVRFAQFCGDYAQSQLWDDALRNCDQALERNPGAVSVRYQRARILFETDRFEEAMAELGQILEENQFHEDALQLAGYISAKMGMDDQALDYYQQYLELNPGNAAVRMKIAYDLAQAGDPQGAMQLIQVGLDVNPDDVDLLEQFGNFAFAAGFEINQQAAVGSGTENGGGVVPEAATYFRQAIDAYQKVFEAKGADTPVGHLKNVVIAYIQLDELDQAISLAEQALVTHPQEESLWSFYADALQRSGQLDQAIAALDRVKEINPTYPNVSLRQGNWLIQAGRIQDAVAILKDVAAEDPQQAESAARLIFADGYGNGFQKDRFDYGVRAFAAAKQLPNLSTAMMHQLNFWEGFSIFQGAIKEQLPGTLATAQATLPKFQHALRLFQNVGDYPQSLNVSLDQVLGNTNTYIEIQEAIIKRGR